MSNLGLGDLATVGTLFYDELKGGNVVTENLEVKGKIEYVPSGTDIDIEGGASINIDIGYQAGNSTSVNNVNVGQSCGAKPSDGTVNIGVACGFTGAAQGDNCVAIGSRAGRSNQSNGDGVGGCVAIGEYAGAGDQAGGGVAIGSHAASDTQGAYAVAIGASAGATSEGANSVCIGKDAGRTTCHDGCIVLNASGAATATTQANSFFVKTIRSNPNTPPGPSGSLWYDGNEVMVNP